MTQPPPREFSDEEIRQIEAEMDKLQVEDVLLQTLVTLINLGARKAGLAAPPGEEPAGDEPEDQEERQGGQGHPGDRAAPPDLPGTGPSTGPRRSRRSGGRHLPITAFMLSANCCGLIDSWNSLAMLSSRASAWVGLSAWSHDCPKYLALLEVS